MIEDNLKKCEEENNVLKSENKKLLKKLRQKGKKVLEIINDVNENHPDFISSKENYAIEPPAFSHISPDRSCSSSSTSTLQPLSTARPAASPPYSTSLSPRTPPTGCSANTNTVTLSIGPSGLAAQEIPPLEALQTHLQS